MTFADFTALPEDRQLAAVYATGTYVARRWPEADRARLLYEMPKRFFVELTYRVDANDVQHLCAFEAGGADDRLGHYARWVRLPAWLPEAK